MGPVSDRERGGGLLSVDDCRCPVCLDIFIEPVTLPCSHTFCKSCFLESVDKATLCCPMCRKRVSTWARHSNRNNSLVNEKLWTQIQTCFPLQCQRRASGQEEEVDTAVSFPRVCEPGELRQEYEDQVTKLTEEKRVMDEEERKASEEYIQKLLAEEHELLQNEIKRSKEDERLAQLLSHQLNSGPRSQESLHPADTVPTKKKKEVGSGQIERYLCPLPSKASLPDSNKENFISSHLKEDTPPPPYGLQPTSLNPEDQTIGCHLITDSKSSSSKRKSSVLTEEEEELVVTKRDCPSSSLEPRSLVLQWEKELLSRQRQEEEDRHLAMLLQKKLNEEERRRSTDRRKGSADAYQLRQKCESKVEEATPRGALRRFQKTPTSSDSSTTSSSPPSSSKQTTLTELFSNLRN